jgi:hypothetical protein
MWQEWLAQQDAERKVPGFRSNRGAIAHFTGEAT